MAQDKLLQIRAIRENARAACGSRYEYDSLIELILSRGVVDRGEP